MKPETEKALRAADIDVQQSVIRLLCEIMSPSDFVGALLSDKEEVSRDGQLVYTELDSYFADGDPTISEDNSYRLHEAICEDRRQDAVDLLNEITNLNFRTVTAQMNLFPNRITL